VDEFIQVENNTGKCNSEKHENQLKLHISGFQWSTHVITVVWHLNKLTIVDKSVTKTTLDINVKENYLRNLAFVYKMTFLWRNGRTISYFGW